MKTPHDAKLSQARAAGMAHATAGRARAFEIKRPQPDASEIAEGVAEYNARRGRTDTVDEDWQYEHEELYADWDF